MVKPLAATLKTARKSLGLSQQDVADILDISKTAVSRWESGDSAPERKRIPHVARALGLSLDVLRELAEEHDPQGALPGLGAIPGVPMPGQSPPGASSSAELDPDIKVFSAAYGSEDDLGAMVLSAEPVQFIPRPAPLLGVTGAYGVLILGDSMSPAYEAGDLALVNPSLPPRPRNFCIFQGTRADGTPLALVKRLVRENSTNWSVQQYEPAKTFALPKPSWGRPHVIVGKYGRV